MKKLRIFRTAFVNELRRSITDNLPKYTADEPWANELAPASERDLETRLELQKPLDLLEPEGSDLKDLENAIRVHKALRQLSPLQARDPRLWVRLTHCELWSYMRKRWPAERYLIEGEKAVRSNQLALFGSAKPKSRSLAQWHRALGWTAFVNSSTSNPNRANNYELTGTLSPASTSLSRSLSATWVARRQSSRLP